MQPIWERGIKSSCINKFSLFGNDKVNLNILGGGFVGYNVSAKQKIDDVSFQNTNGDYTSFNAGFTIGLGFSIMQQHMFFEMRGNRGLVNISKIQK